MCRNKVVVLLKRNLLPRCGYHNLDRLFPSNNQLATHINQTRNSSSRTSFDGSKNPNKNRFYYPTIIGFSGLVVSLTAYKKLKAFQIDEADDNISRSKSLDTGIENKVKNSQVYSRKQVSEHDSIDKGVWIIYKQNVYDITDFIRHHPGGSHTIMMGAGGDVEPFWQTYTVHHATEVQKLLSQYYIGELSLEDRIPSKEQKSQTIDENNPYSDDPDRNPLLKVHTKQPFNAETPSKMLLPTYLTPTDIFFVRNHLPVPKVDPEDYTLSVCIGSDGDSDSVQLLIELTLDDLKTKFKPYSVDCVIQCSGNRRSDLKKIKEIKGLDWNVGAIGNARWTGVRFVDLIAYVKESVGVRSDLLKSTFKHVQLEGLDCDMTGQSYGASISADVAFDPNKEVILAYEMNGMPLTRDHGFPIRFIAPGVTGARNVKWLSKIILSHEESHSHWQRKDYKSFSPNIDMFNLDFEQSISIQETPVQSAICDPVEGDKLQLAPDQMSFPVKGYAFSGGGKMIIRVDVSIDGGKNWLTANIEDMPKNSIGLPDYTDRNRIYSWTRWSIDLPVSELLKQRNNNQVEIICRAFDSSYNSQPERAETIWNVRGVVNNSWHKVKLNIDNTTS